MRPRRWVDGSGGGAGGSGDVGSRRGISWDGPLRSNSRIFMFFEKVSGPIEGPSDLWMDRPCYRDARTHLEKP